MKIPAVLHDILLKKSAVVKRPATGIFSNPERQDVIMGLSR